jgi:dTMP kinase
VARGRLITVEGLDGAGKTTLVGRLAAALDERGQPVFVARAQLVEEELRPMLERGDWVLLDRFADSSLAYQGAGRGLGIDAVRALNEFGTGGLAPDRTLLLRIDPKIGLARLAGEADADRLEHERDEFFTAIASAYDELAETEPERIAVIDASRDPDAVLADALQAVAPLL